MNTLTRVGHSWRSSYWFVTTVVGFGIFVDTVVFTILIPVTPFYLSHKGFTNVPALVGWLFTAYSVGLASSTLPLNLFSARSSSRKWPLVAGMLLLIVSQFMFWEAPSYPVMVVAEILEGLSSALGSIFGLTLICDRSPPEVVGRHLGFAMGGIAVGTIIGPPLGSILYDHFGIAGILTLDASLASVGLIGRLLIIERRTDASSAEETPAALDLHQCGDEVKAYSFFEVIKHMAASSRLMCTLCLELVNFGIVMSMLETSLPLRLKDAYSMNTTQVGLFFLICGAPTFIAPPLAGYLIDKFGPEWVLTIGTVLCIPWWLLLFVHVRFALFAVIYALDRFVSIRVYSACSAEVARASKRIEGVYYTHVYAMSTCAYGVGSIIGPTIAGQLSAHLHGLGWTIICILVSGVRLLAVPFLFWWTGDIPLRKRFQKAVGKGAVHEPKD
ncbi:hypothetical protein ONZ45_g1576 [Pleurotus djamor]|nr:hypothetical protein ONZ45_g1576 [Pleurotus djamor]